MPTMRPSSPSHTSPVIATVLGHDDRHRVDAAGEGLYRVRHVDRPEELLPLLRRGGADVVLVGMDRCDASVPKTLARLAREFPRVPAVAILSADTPGATPAALAMGQAGVRRIVDVRTPGGWHALRHLLAQERQGMAERRMAATVREVLPGAHEDLRRFFDVLIDGAEKVRTVRQLSARLGVRAPSLTSRFFRAGIPAPKRFLAMARLIRAAALLENPGMSIAQAAYRLGYSSPQCFNRHVRRWTGTSAYRFRHAHGLDGMLRHFRDVLLVPHREALQALRPLGGEAHRPPRHHLRNARVARAPREPLPNAA